MQWCDFACGHNQNEVDDNTYCHCLKSYNQNEERLNCPDCQIGSTTNAFFIFKGR